VAIKQDFATLYYKTAFCLTSNIIADFNPVSRIAGVDVSHGMGTVFTAMGTRYDINLVADEAFLATDSHESDTRSVDGVPVAETMKWVRGEMIREGSLPEKYKGFVENVRDGKILYEDYEMFEAGDVSSQTLFLISPAEKSPAVAATAFRKFVSDAFCTNKYGDLGYLKIQLEMADLLDESEEEALAAYSTIVTDDQFVLDALLIRFVGLKDKIVFIDEFLAGKLGINETRVAIHESGIINRLYPLRNICYKSIFVNALYPHRCGYDTTDSGIAGGLGLTNQNIQKKIAARRVKDLQALEAEVILTPCAAEAYGLELGGGEVCTLLEYAASL